MPRETIYLRDPAGQELVKGVWKYARGYVPGEPNEGLVEQLEGSPARWPTTTTPTGRSAPTWLSETPTGSASYGFGLR
ncbi:MAG: hypothetical protein CM1200mP22_06790 [Dehalococcoidia bacterium]|nr:MAG: hypothetical protein CM1200mP22_06790 [Dehalococcoidia bacterium]